MAADKFDVYSVGLIVVRCLFPSLTSRVDMESFIGVDLRRAGGFERFLDGAARGIAGTPGRSQSDAKLLDSDPTLAPLRSLLCSMLAPNPTNRANVKSCVESRLMQKVLATI
jgi:hypothetical protein